MKMGSFKRDKKEEEDNGGNPFQNIEKTSVLQEARIFNDNVVNPRKCTLVLTKLLYLLNQGEQLSVEEATDVFFAMTKLFQSKDVILRRMVYLGIKELSGIAADVIIVTSSLTKDMTGNEDLYRAAAIRALCSITDGTMLQSIERYMKQAIVDRNSSAVSSAALVSSLHLTKIAPDVVKRWVNEAQEAINSDNIMVQYHALGLLYHLRKSDRLAVIKLVAKLTGMPLKSPYAVCLLIRIAAKLIEEDDTSNGHLQLFNYIESCLRHKSEMVVYEAANAIVNLSRTTSGELTMVSAISVLQLFCSSPKATLRFAAVRTLSQVVGSMPRAVTACNLELENLITDSNRSIATLAITTLLKTGAESSVDRLMKQIATFVSEISDEFKVVVVQAIRALALKYPRKHTVVMNFLSGMLRDEGGLDYKASIADTIITMIEENADTKEIGLAQLCEFIEDCEHTSLAVRILHLLGKEGPTTKHPFRYIRFIYNRVILENPVVRAAAVTALAQFGATCPQLRNNIQVLLVRCQMDTDDEVRDRATYYSSILDKHDNSLYSAYILDILQVSIPALERALCEYTENMDYSKPFDVNAVPLAIVPPKTDDLHKSSKHEGMLITPNTSKVVKPVDREVAYIDLLQSKIPNLSEFGTLFKVSECVALTETETEYYVKCVKYCYEHHVIVQFDCLNTLNDQLLENVRVQVDASEGYVILNEIPCERIAYNETGHIFVVMQFPDSGSELLSNSVGTFGVVLKFVVKDCDPNTGQPDTDDGYIDEYMLEDFEITLSDQIQKLTKANFAGAWEEASTTCVELEDTYSLSSMQSLDKAVKNIVQFLGLQPAERSDKVPDGKTTHTLLLAGKFRGGIDILVRAKLALSDGVTMQLTVRSTDANVAELITSTVG